MEQETTENKNTEIKRPEEVKHHKKKKLNIFLLLIVVLGVIFIINLALIASLSSTINQSLEKAKELSKPANIDLILIKDSNCGKDCFNLDNVVEVIKNNNVDIKNIKDIDYKSDEAKQLISKYEIIKIPTLLVFGDINKTGEMNLVLRNDSLVLENVGPVYLDLSKNEYIGRISLTLIKDSGCTKCVDLNPLINQFIRAGVIISKETTLEVSQAQDLIKKYNITQAPALILSRDAGIYSAVREIWQQLGSIESDGSFVTRSKVLIPYKDLTTNQVIGLVKLTYLEDKSCSDCYNVSLHKSILSQNFGLVVNQEEYVDTNSAEGKSLITKYKIKGVPTIIMSNDAQAYDNLIQAWNQVGTVESDGTLIFRNLDVLGVPYKDLEKNQVITPAIQQQTQ